MFKISLGSDKTPDPRVIVAFFLLFKALLSLVHEMFGSPSLRHKDSSSQVAQELSSSTSSSSSSESKTKLLPLLQRQPVNFKMTASTTLHPKIQSITTSRIDKYHDKVVSTYDDPPEMWHKALGADNLSFQFGLFSPDKLSAGPVAGPIGPSEFRHFDRQLELSGLLSSAETRGSVKRILDLGCGWGYISRRLAEVHFPDEDVRIDAINIFPRQLQYCAETMPENLQGKINLFLCNGQDVDLLPDPEIPYDLVVVRGVYTHFLPEVFAASVARVVQRLRKGGILLISDTLYKVDINKYKPPIPDQADRLACGNRKSPEYFCQTIEQAGCKVRDIRVLPSNCEVIHWFHKVRLNIEENFPEGVTGPIQELHEMAHSFTKSLAADKASVYSVILQKL